MSAGTADGDSPDDDAANRGGDQTERTPLRRSETGRWDGIAGVALALVGVGVVARPARARADRGRRRGIRRLRPDRRGARGGDDRGRADRERRHPAPDDDVVVTVGRTTSATLPSRTSDSSTGCRPDWRSSTAQRGSRPRSDRGDRGLRVHRPGEPRRTRVGADARDHARRRRRLKSARPSARRRPGSSAPGALGGRRPPARADDDIMAAFPPTWAAPASRVPPPARVPPRRPRQADRLEPAGADGGAGDARTPRGARRDRRPPDRRPRVGVRREPSRRRHRRGGERPGRRAGVHRAARRRGPGRDRDAGSARLLALAGSRHDARRPRARNAGDRSRAGADAERGGSSQSLWFRRFRRRLPADAQVLFFTPLLDDSAASLAHRIDAHGHLVTVLSPDVTAGDTPERGWSRSSAASDSARCARGGIRAVEWGDRSFPVAVARATGRWSR